MSTWDAYPSDYRNREIQAIRTATRAGECVSLVGLSGSGKSNLLGFLAQQPFEGISLRLVDCNRLVEFTAAAFFSFVRHTLGDSGEAADEMAALEVTISRHLELTPALCLLLDRFDALAEAVTPAIFSNLRALRDAHKYALTYITATRRPLNPHNELAELFFANTIWLGALSESDARWNIERYAQRKGLKWDKNVIHQILSLSWGYPSLLRAVCEAHSAGCSLDTRALADHPAVRRRVEEFWADHPGEEELRCSGLTGHPLLVRGCSPETMDTTQFTAKENLLWAYFLAHPDQVCEKDDLIRAVWSEDKIYARGIRDDSLAQVVRRLREKVEADPSNPRLIHTVAGRGYRFTPEWEPR